MCLLSLDCTGCRSPTDPYRSFLKKLLRNWQREEDLGHLLEPPLAVLALISDPSSFADAGSVDAFPRVTVFVTGFRRGGVRQQHEGKQSPRHQIFVDSSLIAPRSNLRSEYKNSSLTFPPHFHGSSWVFLPSRSTKRGLLGEKA